MVFDLPGRQVVVTGAGGALGTAVADRALELGARLTLVDLHAPRGSMKESWISVDLTDALFAVAGGFDTGPPTRRPSPR